MPDYARRLRNETIERKAVYFLFNEAWRIVLRNPPPPVPVEEIVELHLNLQLGFCDVKARFGIENVLGATIASTRQMFIDESLDPIQYPKREGRYLFTVAHEIGHWILHPRDRCIHFPSENSGIYVGDLEEFERQADTFAAYLLMPRSLVQKEWERLHGRFERVRISRQTLEIGVENLGSRKEALRAFSEHYAEPLRARFKVSMEAMRYRLEELDLLPPHLP